jgi:hypothetical protein
VPPLIHPIPSLGLTIARRTYSNEKVRFQSFFMLITVQPSFFASSYSACVKVPTFVSGSHEWATSKPATREGRRPGSAPQLP